MKKMNSRTGLLLAAAVALAIVSMPNAAHAKKDPYGYAANQAAMNMFLQQQAQASGQAYNPYLGGAYGAGTNYNANQYQPYSNFNAYVSPGAYNPYVNQNAYGAWNPYQYNTAFNPYSSFNPYNNANNYSYNNGSYNNGYFNGNAYNPYGAGYGYNSQFGQSGQFANSRLGGLLQRFF